MAKHENAPRIAIYGVGQYGQYIVRFAAQKGWEIVAAFNRAGPKIGQDVGRLAGLDRDLGVVVEDCETADFSKVNADVGVVAMTDRIAQNFPAYQRLMNAGLNVICHGGTHALPASTRTRYGHGCRRSTDVGDCGPALLSGKPAYARCASRNSGCRHLFQGSLRRCD